jgi:hypothetical protein
LVRFERVWLNLRPLNAVGSSLSPLLQRVELEVGEEIFGISAALKAAPANPTINNTPATSFASHSRLRSLILQV